MKKFLIMSQKKDFFIYFQKWKPALLIPGMKNNKNLPREHFLYSREMELSSFNI